MNVFFIIQEKRIFEIYLGFVYINNNVLIKLGRKKTTKYYFSMKFRVKNKILTKILEISYCFSFVDIVYSCLFETSQEYKCIEEVRRVSKV